MTEGGFDAQNEVYVEDMIAAGIVDPTKVTRSALENAASVASMVLTIILVVLLSTFSKTKLMESTVK